MRIVPSEENVRNIKGAFLCGNKRKLDSNEIACLFDYIAKLTTELAEYKQAEQEGEG